MSAVLVEAQASGFGESQRVANLTIDDNDMVNTSLGGYGGSSGKLPDIQVEAAGSHGEGRHRNISVTRNRILQKALHGSAVSMTDVDGVRIIDNTINWATGMLTSEGGSPPPPRWWERLNDTALVGPDGHHASCVAPGCTSHTTPPGTTNPVGATQCAGSCDSDAACAGWSLIKVTPTSGQRGKSPLCLLRAAAGIASVAPFYASDANFDCGTKRQLQPNSSDPSPPPPPPHSSQFSLSGCGEVSLSGNLCQGQPC